MIRPQLKRGTFCECHYRKRRIMVNVIIKRKFLFSTQGNNMRTGKWHSMVSAFLNSIVET
jgi:hypothetical protein